jgi:hypothetical protein
MSKINFCGKEYSLDFGNVLFIEKYGRAEEQFLLKVRGIDTDESNPYEAVKAQAQAAADFFIAVFGDEVFNPDENDTRHNLAVLFKAFAEIREECQRQTDELQTLLKNTYPAVGNELTH